MRISTNRRWPHFRSLLVLGVLCSLSAACPAGETTLKGLVANNCPPIAFVKRHHLRKPFGVGTIYCWDVYSPGGGIYTYNPAHPERGHTEIFRRDNGTIYDMSSSFDGTKLLFSWMAIKEDEAFKAAKANGEVEIGYPTDYGGLYTGFAGP